ncbi:NAD(P)-binding protein [Artomyces pyxidatus]|uniref:NAD(P)-binding protein n=1 Tax=Artomyces pyxidatus TaxID=48021 RepID=A0ACB8SZE8_9AGAM|nr:NAD(P)-binding protein [Artomyces pyxidatus]
MTTIVDDQLYVHAHRANGQVAVITGGASGIGKETALQFAKHGAKVVIGDLDAKGAEAVVNEIRKANGDAASIRCDVLNWDEQVALFELALSRYGSVDIVIPNAGVSETDSVCRGELEYKDGLPVRPKLLTLHINLTAVVHTVHLGLHYMKRNRKADDWKALVLIGSMASWIGVPSEPQYCASKHAMLGLMRSLHPVVAKDRIRVSVIHPWFADTNIIPPEWKSMLKEFTLTPVPRIAGAILLSATDPDWKTSGCPWVLLDGGPVLRLDRERLNTGVYAVMNRRASGKL